MLFLIYTLDAEYTLLQQRPRYRCRAPKRAAVYAITHVMTSEPPHAQRPALRGGRGGSAP